MGNRTDTRKQVTIGIRTLIARLSTIGENLKAGNTIITADRYQRWKERTLRFLREHVSEAEAKRFSAISESKSSIAEYRLKENIASYTRALTVLVEEIEDDPYFVLATSEINSPPRTNKQSASQVNISVIDTRDVFVVHGRDLNARNSLFRFLRSIGLRPLEWSQAIKETGKAAPFIGEILDVAFSNAQAVVVLMTPDDVAQLQEPFRSPHDPPYESQLTGQARPNVLFEAGMAMGRNPDRTIIVELGPVRPFSDIAGRHTVRLSNNTAARQELAQRLNTAGCAVDLTGRDWHTEGDFNPHKEPTNPLTVHIESQREVEAESLRSIRNKEADRKLFDELKKDLPFNGSIRFIRDHIMGAFSFEMKSLDDLYVFLGNWVDVEHEFLDSELEEKRRRLYTLIDEYTNFIELNTFPTKDGASQSIPPEWMHEQNDKYVRVVNQLHGKASEVVTAHQDLIRTARNKLGI